MSQLAAFAREELALQLTEGQERAVGEFEDGSFEQAVWQWGRRSGKSLLSDVIAVYDATVRDHLRRHMRPGEPRVAAIIAPRLDQATEHVKNCARLVRSSPRVRELLIGETAEALSFANGSEIRAFPCSARGIRGGAWSSCVLDELGHFISSDEGNAAGDRILEAVLPALATFQGAGWLVAISTPLWRQGAFWRLVERASSGRFAHIHYKHGSTLEMNGGRVSAKWLEERRREDPDLYRREFEAQFIDGASSYLSSTDILACVRREPLIRRPEPQQRYVGALDPAYSHDAFAMAVGHEENGQVVIDGVWTWTRHGHEATLDQVTLIAQMYGLRSLRTDQHAAEPIREGLAKRHLEADYRPWTSQSKADAFSALKVAVNTAGIELPDEKALIEELCRIEARPTAGGYTRIAAAAGGHDDRAVVVASVVHTLAGRDDSEGLRNVARAYGVSDEELAGLRDDAKPPWMVDTLEHVWR